MFAGTEPFSRFFLYIRIERGKFLFQTFKNLIYKNSFPNKSKKKKQKKRHSTKIADENFFSNKFQPITSCENFFLSNFYLFRRLILLNKETWQRWKFFSYKMTRRRALGIGKILWRASKLFYELLFVSLSGFCLFFA